MTAKHQNHSPFYSLVAWQLASLIFLVGSKQASAQAVVGANRSFEVATSYESVMKRLDGEEVSRKMFASQHLQLLQYSPRKKAESQQKDNEKVSVQIDIVGNSCEYGLMRYLLTVEANEKLAIIQVSMVEPVGMLRSQSYRYTITPQGEQSTSIRIEHTLDVVLMMRKSEFVNKVIRKVTYKKACEQVVALTNSMTNCVRSIVDVADFSEKIESASTMPDDRETSSMGTALPELKVNENEAKPESTNEKQRKHEADKSDSVVPTPANSSNSASTDSTQPTENPIQPAKKLDDATNSDVSENVEQRPVKTPEQTNAKELNLPRQSSLLDAPSVEAMPTVKAADPTVEKVESNNKSKMSEPISSTKIDQDEREAKPQAQIAKAENSAPVLRITIEGVSRGTGAMRIALFDSEKQFQAFDARNDESKQGMPFARRRSG